MSKNPLGKLQQRSVKAAPDATAPAASPASAPAKGRKPRGTGDVVWQTVRLRREDWQNMGMLRIKEGMTAQEQFLKGLGLLFAQYNMPPPEQP